MCLKDLEKKMANFDMIDIGMIKWSCLFFGFALAAYFPAILSFGWLPLLAISLVLAVRPISRFFAEKKKKK